MVTRPALPRRGSAHLDLHYWGGDDCRPCRLGPPSHRARLCAEGPGLPTVRGLHRHSSPLVRAADPRRLFAVSGDHTHAFVDPGDDVLLRRGLNIPHLLPSPPLYHTPPP